MGVPQENVTPDSKFFGLFVGRSSSGKSCAAASFPKPLKNYDADLRKGFVGAKFLNKKGNNWEPWPPRRTSIQDIEKEMTSLENLYFMAKQRPYETIQLTSINSVMRLAINDGRKLVHAGREKGGVQLTGPGDFNFAYQAVYNLFDFLKMLPCHVIIECQVQPRWVKDDKKKEDGTLLEYQENVQEGETLSGLPPNLGETVLGMFDEVYRFSKNDDGTKHYVEFYGNIARSIYDLPKGKIEITNQEFYPLWKGLVDKAMAKESKP